MPRIDDRVEQILRSSPTIALVGASPNAKRPSHGVMKFLLDRGFQVIPVRPEVREVLGRPCFDSLDVLEEKVDIVDVFRRAEACPEIARQAVAIGARVLWLQEGIISAEAAAIAREGGLAVVMDRCILKVIQEMD